MEAATKNKIIGGTVVVAILAFLGWNWWKKNKSAQTAAPANGGGGMGSLITSHIPMVDSNNQVVGHVDTTGTVITQVQVTGSGVDVPVTPSGGTGTTPPPNCPAPVITNFFLDQAGEMIVQWSIPSGANYTGYRFEIASANSSNFSTVQVPLPSDLSWLSGGISLGKPGNFGQAPTGMQARMYGVCGSTLSAVSNVKVLA